MFRSLESADFRATPTSFYRNNQALAFGPRVPVDTTCRFQGADLFSATSDDSMYEVQSCRRPSRWRSSKSCPHSSRSSDRMTQFLLLLSPRGVLSSTPWAGGPGPTSVCEVERSFRGVSTHRGPVSSSRRDQGQVKTRFPQRPRGQQQQQHHDTSIRFNRTLTSKINTCTV